MSSKVQISVDASDPAALAGFWALALGYVEQPPPEGFGTWSAWAEAEGLPEERMSAYAALVDPEGSGPRLLFQRVPEAKTAKNRFHLDVGVGGPDHSWETVQEHVARLVEAGGSLVEERSELGERWVVLTDPEGNEFCVQ